MSVSVDKCHSLRYLSGNAGVFSFGQCLTFTNLHMQIMMCMHSDFELIHHIIIHICVRSSQKHIHAHIHLHSFGLCIHVTHVTFVNDIRN